MVCLGMLYSMGRGCLGMIVMPVVAFIYGCCIAGLFGNVFDVLWFDDEFAFAMLIIVSVFQLLLAILVFVVAGFNLRAIFVKRLEGAKTHVA